MPYPIIHNGYNFSGQLTNSASFVISTPMHDEGDEMFIAFVQDGAATLTLAGWTNLFGDISIDGTAVCALFHRTATGSEPATYTITSTVSERAAWGAWAICNFGGFDGTPEGTFWGTGDTATPVSYTTTVPNALFMMMILCRNSGTPTGGGGIKLGEFGVDSGGSLGVRWMIREQPGALSTSLTLSISRAFAVITFAVAPDDTSPSPAPTPEASSLQRIRTYPA